MKTHLFAALMAGALAASRAEAHHSIAATYVLDQEVTLRGTVEEFLLRNPHSFLLVDTPDAIGLVQRWNIEWGAGAALASRGINRQTLKAGDEVTITFMPGKRSEDHRGLLKILRRPADGFEWGTKPGEIITPWGMVRNGTGGIR
jgi:uncharacterized protein DUF6152